MVGSSAATVFALSSASSADQVASVGSGKRQLSLPVTVVPPSVMQRVAADHGAVAGVEEGDMPGRVAGRGDDLE